MSASNYAKSLGFTLGYEGGWSNNPADPGGATMCGITQRVYDDDRERRNLPLQSVRLSTEAERAAIYRARYWDRVQGDILPDGVDYCCFDYAVNSGVRRSIETLQRIVGVTDDGVIGKYTMAAIDRFCGQYQVTALTDAICNARMDFLRHLRTFNTFGHGWTVRVMGHQDGTQADDTGVIDRAYDMAVGAEPKVPVNQIVTPKTYLRAA